MNPFALSATGLLAWGIVAHLIADWPLQNAWIAEHKALRQIRWRPAGTTDGPDGNVWPRLAMAPGEWWDRHPAAFVHAGIHGALLAAVFGWPAILVALAHLIIDTRTPLAWWSALIRQTPPAGEPHFIVYWKYRQEHAIEHADVALAPEAEPGAPLIVDMGALVRMATDQVAHVATIALAALVVGGLA